MHSRIHFFSEEINFVLKDKKKVKEWLCRVIEEENQGTLDLNYIFCSDPYLLGLNKKYLNHSAMTDILTFPDIDPEGRKTGEIFISIDRIRENAEKYHQSFTMELLRVMVHGVLHLTGYQDKTENEKAVMTLKEDHYLNKI